MTRLNHVSPQASQWITPSANEYGQSEWIINESMESQSSMHTSDSNKSSLTFSHLALNEKQVEEDSENKKRTRLPAFFHSIKCTPCLSAIIQSCLLGILIGSIILAVLLVIWLTSKKPITTTAATILSVQITSNMTPAPLTTLTTVSSTTLSTSSTTTTLPSTTTTGCMPSQFGNLTKVGNTNSWDPFTLNFTATNSKHMLIFGFQKGSSGNVYLDDVSIVSKTTPSQELLQNPSFQNSTAVPPDGWTSWCRSSCTGGSGEGGLIITSGCRGGGGGYCYQGSCSGGYLLLGQEFSTVSGEKYMISFYAQITGSSSILSVDVY